MQCRPKFPSKKQTLVFSKAAGLWSPGDNVITQEPLDTGQMQEEKLQLRPAFIVADLAICDNGLATTAKVKDSSPAEHQGDQEAMVQQKFL